MSQFHCRVISTTVHKLYESYLRLPYDFERYQKIKSLLTQNEIDLINKIENYYKHNQSEHVRNEFQKIAQELTSLPFIQAIYGIGFPFYGDVDMRVRIYDSMVKYRLGEMDAEQFQLAILPDYDLFLVYAAEPGHVVWDFSDQGYIDNKFEDDFSRLLAKNRSYNEDWKKIRQKLLNTLGVALHQNNNSRYVNLFKYSQLLPLDLVPVPMHFWEATPYFCLLEDFSKIRFLRDLMLTGTRVTSSKNILYIPKWYRLHVVLRTFYYRFLKKEHDLNLSENNFPLDLGFTYHELMQKIYQQQPHANILSIFPEARSELDQRYYYIISYALFHGFLKQEENNLHVITPKGIKYIQTVLKKRDYLLRHSEYFSQKAEHIYNQYYRLGKDNFYSAEKIKNPFTEDIF